MLLRPVTFYITAVSPQTAKQKPTRNYSRESKGLGRHNYRGCYKGERKGKGRGKGGKEREKGGGKGGKKEKEREKNKYPSHSMNPHKGFKKRV